MTAALTDTPALLQVAESSRESGDWPTAIQAAQSILLADARNADALAMLALVLPQLGRLDEAAQAATSALAMTPAHPVALRGLAIVQLRQNRLDEAVATGQLALAADPTCPRSLVAMGAIHLARQELDAAQAVLEHALRIEPVAEAHINYASVLMRRNEPAQALAHALAATQKKPFLVAGWQLLAALYQSAGKVPQAIAALEQVTRLQPANMGALTQLGELYRQVERLDDAVATLEQAARAAGTSAAAWASYATALQANGRLVQAVTAYENALAINPDQAEAYSHLAAMHVHREVWSLAVAVAMNAAARTRSPLAQPLAPMLDGDHYGIALALYQHALRLKPGYSEASLGMGNIYRAVGRFADARNAYAAAVDMSPQSVSGYNALGLLLLDLDMCDQAREWLSRGLAAAPNAWPLASPMLIACWIGALYEQAEAVARAHFENAVTRQATSTRNKAVRVFVTLVTALLVARQRHPGLYAPAPAAGELAVVGESHSLSPANAVFGWFGASVVARTRFVMGIKMHHLAQADPNHFKACLASHLHAAASAPYLLLTVGEIDCRADEGIWATHLKHQVPIELLVDATVNGYLDWLARQLADRPSGSVTVQGIPAPAYPLDGLQVDERREFLRMIRAVNEALKAGALARGWHFLDVYAATASADGTSNGQWHIDGFHLQPAFYAQAHRWLRSPQA